MTRLVRTSELTKLPVVTLAGEAIAQVKDVVYAADGGTVGGFTLAGRGLLAGPLKQGVSWSSLLGVGRDAVVVAGDEALEPVAEVVAAASGSGAGGSGGKVLGSQVLTESGVELGSVVDVVLQFDEGRGSGVGPCDVVGYEIEASDALAAASSHGRAKGTRLLVPLPDTLAVSKEHLMVPAGAEGFVTQDLAGFGAAVSAFRAQLAGGTRVKFSDLKGNKAVSTSSADTVGKVSGLLLDPATRSIRALELKKTGGGTYARWSDLTGVGADAVTVPDSAVIVESGEGIDDLVGKDHAVLKKRVLSTAGDELGKVKDLDFDPDTGDLRYLVVGKEEIAGNRLRGIGSYAVVVDAD